MEDLSNISEGPYHVYQDNKQAKTMVFIEGLFCMKGIHRNMWGHLKTRNVYSYEMINHFD